LAKLAADGFHFLGNVPRVLGDMEHHVHCSQRQRPVFLGLRGRLVLLGDEQQLDWILIQQPSDLDAELGLGHLQATANEVRFRLSDPQLIRQRIVATEAVPVFDFFEVLGDLEHLFSQARISRLSVAASYAALAVWLAVIFPLSTEPVPSTAATAFSMASSCVDSSSRWKVK